VKDKDEEPGRGVKRHAEESENLTMQAAAVEEGRLEEITEELEKEMREQS